MAQLTGGSFKRISPEDIKVRRSALNQLVDVLQEDVSGSTTRRAYQVFVTGGVGPGVTSSLYQTVYDQDFTLQTANPIFDMTIGLYESGSTVTNCSTGIDSAGKLLFPSQSLMMREKVDVYKQYAKVLLGDSDSTFSSPFGDASANTETALAAQRAYFERAAAEWMERARTIMKPEQNEWKQNLISEERNMSARAQ